jgi:hypothetical protein
LREVKKQFAPQRQLKRYAVVSLQRMIMLTNVNDIVNTPYGENAVSCEPSPQDISDAIERGELEERAYQRDIDDLTAEWRRESKDNALEWYRLVKTYHARRIAFFVIRGWQESIVLRADGQTIQEGLHRFKAALYLGMREVETTLVTVATA